MEHIEKVAACVVQDNAILCFSHPSAGNQIPKGTVEVGEDLTTAVIRELWEEAGIDFSGTPRPIGTLERIVPGGPRENGPLESHTWHLFVMPMRDLPATWTHQAIGSAEEQGLEFRYFWQPLEGAPKGFADIFLQVIARVKASMQRD